MSIWGLPREAFLVAFICCTESVRFIASFDKSNEPGPTVAVVTFVSRTMMQVQIFFPALFLWTIDIQALIMSKKQKECLQ